MTTNVGVMQQSQTQQKQPFATTMTDDPSSLPQMQQRSVVSGVTANDSQPNNGTIADVCNLDSVILDADNNHHPSRQHAHLAEKRELIGKLVAVKSKDAETLTWVVTKDTKKADNPDDVKFLETGLLDFNFNHTPKRFGGNKKKRINFLKVLIKLRPGSWEEQLVTRLNRRICDKSEQKRRNFCSLERPNVTTEVSPSEFWVFQGLILAARVCGKKVGNLWMKGTPDVAWSLLQTSLKTCQSSGALKSRNACALCLLMSL